MNSEPPFKLIALVGGSGSGKSWLANRLGEEYGGDATSLCLDNFYHDLAHLALPEREKINFDHPDAIDWPLFKSTLQDLQNGMMVFAPRYDFVSHARFAGRQPRCPRPFILVEGLWLLWPPDVRALFDLRVFLDCPEPLRWQRRLARDVNERGRTENSIREQFWNVVAPMNERFVEVQKPWADLVIEQPISQTNLVRLTNAISALRTVNGPTAWEISRARAITPEVATLHSGGTFYEH